jgi:hypothetical protein
MILINYTYSIYLISKYLGRYESKKHGGYYIYEDEKIIMRYDTYVPNVDVNVKLLDGSLQRVYSKASNSSNPHKYNPGKWEDYIASLISKVEENKKLESDDIDKFNERIQLENFGKVSEKVDNVFN